MSFKDIFIRKIQSLPEDILQEVYLLDVVISRGRLQWNSFLADKYKHHKRELDKNWLSFSLSGWKIQMETEEQHENYDKRTILSSM